MRSINYLYYLLGGVQIWIYLYTNTSHGSHVVLCNYQLFRSNTFEQRYTVASWLLSNIDKRGGTGSLDWVGAESGVQRVRASSLDCVWVGLEHDREVQLVPPH